MFWERFYEICELKKTKPNTVGAKIGVSSATITKWKNGTIPNGEKLYKLAEYLNVSTDYLLGIENPPNETQATPEGLLMSKIRNISVNLPEDKLQVLLNYAQFLASEQIP